ncbi:expressed unknown protein [Ectocarpus siliculosus]|uniref:Uncharacterized protein n=1 Tax=Ectocarpus siliculosus TaxID=2880 RepID=D8LDN9_ECTSI|nr:expressed unknown protein [Ectocarpus siliculosus]|eukprot:CBN78446.1 expressed unknown protein [Ectocarpus siliculosus]
MTGITAPCTCSVDGVSGLADTRYQGYSFTGCGAHVDYTLNTFEGGGYERTWCYVTSPPDCPGESPYIPEGFKTDNTLPEWEALGAAWKECYDGYRCEAWWGGLEGSPDGEPVVLDAPLDWPDCCALCSGSGSDDGDGSGTTSTCVAWSFDPSTGSCQRMSTVAEPSYDYSWGAWNSNNTISGYPGYFEAPLTDCWGRSQYDLCVNTNAAFIIPGVIVAFISLCCMWASGFCAPSARAGLLRELAIEQPQSSRLVKVACAEVACTKTVKSTGKGGTKITYTYNGTFVTRDGAVFNLPPPTRRPKMHEASRRIEKRMLSVLHNTKRNPRADPSLARRCETPDGLRAEFSKMVRAVPRKPEASRSGGSFYRSHVLGHPNVPVERDAAVDHRFDCILLVGTEEPGRTPTKVLLVGILGEDRITCVGEDVLGASVADFCCASFCFVLAAALLFIMCITLLTNEAAQNMAAWTFEGDHRVGAIIGLVLCTCVPLSLFVWKCRKSGKLLRSIRECPLVAESDRVINSRT